MKELDEIFESLKRSVNNRHMTSDLFAIDARRDWPLVIGALAFGPVIDYSNTNRTEEDALLLRLKNIAVEAIVGINSIQRKQRARAWLAEFNERVPVGTEITVRAWSVTPPLSPSFNKARVVAEAEYRKEASEPLIGIDITDGPQPAGDNFVSLDDIKVALPDGWAYIGKNFEPKAFTVKIPADGFASSTVAGADSYGTTLRHVSEVSGGRGVDVKVSEGFER